MEGRPANKQEVTKKLGVILLATAVAGWAVVGIEILIGFGDEQVNVILVATAGAIEAAVFLCSMGIGLYLGERTPVTILLAVGVSMVPMLIGGALALILPGLIPNF